MKRKMGIRDKNAGLRENVSHALGRRHFSLAASASLGYDVENRCDYSLLRKIGARAKPEPRSAAAGSRATCRSAL
jgi:hypothetical protein